ncbi:sigma-70 family RNA polymerase sigma factor [Spongiactinospora sp. TRM90649]|uniref:RNA polymerase sigma factor n=1 Tax=Spongiactinospora sp. TRM90649 TaxID=3031114 RepID=UPI0023F8028F|nr:sigma-70 family RNA polymerase sigma factor [Spongiactinospora sp. TRM90649]MDF5755406.1 sigma-70 family RNA polymerase sigma factor [Spongiactinospora sp. TRM90649]
MTDDRAHSRGGVRDLDLEALLPAAAEGDQGAWNALVDRFGAAMWSAARACGLASADAEDAVQAAWLRLLESMTTIREPRAVGVWLVTTTRREAVRLARRRRHECPSADPGLDDPPGAPGDPVARGSAGVAADVAAAVLDADEAGRLWLAVESMSEPCRSLLRLMATTPDAGTARIAARLGMPMGSVGPTKGRCLRRLRRMVAAQGGDR